ncbi:MAG: T9SS type A sorting domain-containing protein [Flavobacteriales bacterium]|nr:T9SS type A sorting domain-containing protein [Flavobacteriales bacterium]
MKKLFTLAILGLSAFLANAQSIFYEDFESGLLTQFTQEYVVGTQNWVTSTASINTGGAPATFEGDSAAHFYYPGYSGYITTLTSPSLDLSGGGFKLSFEVVQPSWAGDQNTLSVYYSGDDGATWTLIDSITSSYVSYQAMEYALDDYATLTATSKVRFSGWIDYGYAIGLDAVNVFLPPTDDAELVSSLSPMTGCGIADQAVSVLVYNNGLDSILSIDASYTLDAGTPVTESFSVAIAAGETDTLTFTTMADLSATGMHDLMVWVDLLNDQDQTNDTISFSAENIPVISTLPYMEDFENGQGGWTSGGTLNDWQLGDPQTAFIDTAHSGVNAWVTNLTGPYQNNSDQYVESPCMDFSSLTVDPVFRFAFITSSEVNWDGTWIEVSTDAGATWTTVGNVGEGTNWYNNADEHGPNGLLDWWDAPFGGAGEWTTATHLLTGAAGQSSVKVRVFFHSDVSGTDEGFAFDDVEIFEQPSVNAGVVEILSPMNGCGLSASETVKVILQNFGDADLVNFNVEYDAGNGVVTEMMTDTLFSSTTDTFTFATPVDLSVAATYDFGAWTAVAGDGDATNDSLFASVTNSPVITSLPYMEDFENGQGGWVSGGTNSSWELGVPAGTFIDTASSGINAWVTNLSGYYNILEQSYVESPCFDFSSLQLDPRLRLAGIVSSEQAWDGAWIETSVDGGATWTVLGATGEGTNWYNDAFPANGNFPTGWDGEQTQPGMWFEAEHLLDGTAGYSSVKIRVNFSEDGYFNQMEGFGFDNIRIEEQPAINGALTAISSPTTGCGLSAAESITVDVANLGYITMDSIVVSYMVNNGTPVMEVFNGSLALAGDTTLTFSTTVDMSVPGEYDLTVWVSTVGDGDTSNDTMSVMVTNVPIVSNFPYDENFENGAGGWTSMGTNGMWQLGDPEGMLIDTAYSGVNAWATNLDSMYYQNDQLTYLTSPCLDFSNMSDDPIIRFAFIGDSEVGWDGMWLEMTTDGGTTWTTVGQVGDGTNWYNDPNQHGANFDLDWWDGQSGGWLIAERLLDGVAGMSGVQVRFVFSSDVSGVYEGFAVDDISIRPQPQLDLVMLSMDAPMDGCSLDQETVTVTFWNKGLQTVSGFDLGFMVDGNTAQTETYSGSVAHGDSASYTFTVEMADLSTTGMHSIDVFTALSGDEDMTNDTLSNNMVENFGSGTPLTQTEAPGLPISNDIAAGTTSQIFFCGLPQSLDGCLEIASVTIDSIDHTWLSDLDIYLISPAGDTVELSTDNGGSADNMSNVVFTDTSTNDITLQTSDIMPGYYHTEDSLGFAGLYNGQDPNGGWSLFIRDDAGGDDGTLISWSMSFADHSPTPTIAYSDTTICITQVLEVTIDEQYDSYLWSTGHNTQTAQLYGNVLGLGQYEVSVTVDQNGCTGVSNSFMLTVDACAGIEELGNLNIEVYPNPSNGNIVLSVDGSSKELGLTVQDMNGRMVHMETLGEVNSRLQKNIDLSGLANGVYLLRLTNGNDSLIKKLVIQ